MKKLNPNNLFNIVVVVAALGYFVDIYDLILFGIVKNPSLIDLGITNKTELFNTGNFLLSMQMAGMLIGQHCQWVCSKHSAIRGITIYCRIWTFGRAGHRNNACFRSYVERKTWFGCKYRFGNRYSRCCSWFFGC
jgi:hypothetical protein